jgi:hypothetical protein
MKRLKKIDATDYLIMHCSNGDDAVICQICGDHMPFKYTPVGDDAERDYFEAVQFIRSVKREHEANHLALCPNCAAEYKYACKTPEAERVALVRALHSNCTEDALVITLELSTPRSLRFTQCHLIDLQAALKEECGV